MPRGWKFRIKIDRYRNENYSKVVEWYIIYQFNLSRESILKLISSYPNSDIESNFKENRSVKTKTTTNTDKLFYLSLYSLTFSKINFEDIKFKSQTQLTNFTISCFAHHKEF